MYHNYIFDLYGTLIDIHTDEDNPRLWEQMAGLYADNGAVYAPEELKSSYFLRCREAEEELKSGGHAEYPEISIGEVFGKLYRLGGITPGEELISYTAVTFRDLSIEYIRLYPGVEEMLGELRRHKKKIFLLSNAQRLFTLPELDRMGLTGYFDDVFISSDHGIKKPDKGYMGLLLEKHGLNADECIMIGNEWGSDIAAANAWGMDSLFFKSSEEELPEKISATYVVAEGNFKNIDFIYDWKEGGK